MLYDRPFSADELAHRPWTVCFYSFRGGVGRTTLACSVARMLGYLCSEERYDQFDIRPKKCVSLSALKSGPRTRIETPAPLTPPLTTPFTICLLDFDLEAPSIDTYPQFAPPSQNQKGVLDYIRHFDEKEFADSIPPYVYPADASKSLFVMRAGSIDDPAYVEYLSNLDWNRLYREKQCGWMFENLRAGLKQELACEYLLVDSRPGLNRLGGVCMGHLADAAVLVFQPTVAHLAGLAQVVARLRERERTEKRRIPRLYVATRFMRPSEDSDLPEAWLQAEKMLQVCEGYHTWDEVESMDAHTVWNLDTRIPDLPDASPEGRGSPKPVQSGGVHWRNAIAAAVDPPRLLADRFPWCDPDVAPNELECESGNVAKWVAESRLLWEEADA